MQVLYSVGVALATITRHSTHILEIVARNQNSIIPESTASTLKNW